MTRPRLPMEASSPRGVEPEAAPAAAPAIAPAVTQDTASQAAASQAAATTQGTAAPVSTPQEDTATSWRLLEAPAPWVVVLVVLPLSFAVAWRAYARETLSSGMRTTLVGLRWLSLLALLQEAHQSGEISKLLVLSSQGAAVAPGGVHRHGELGHIAAFKVSDLADTFFLHLVDTHHGMQGDEGALHTTKFGCDALFGRINQQSRPLSKYQFFHFQEPEKLSVTHAARINLVDLPLIHEGDLENVLLGHTFSS